MILLLLLAQEDGVRTAEVPNAMGLHTWFIIIAFGTFLAWAISYSLYLHKEALKRKKGREDLFKWREQLIDQIVELEAQKEAATIPDKKYKQEMKELRSQLSKVIDRLGQPRQT
jgi:hypothetical protein